MTQLNERVEAAIKASGKTATDIAAEIGCKPAAIYQWLNGDTKNIRNELLFKFADKTGFNARWIATGEGEMRAADYLPPDETALLQKYRQSDARGKQVIQRVADVESPYEVEPGHKTGTGD